ncbi:MAG: 1-deoxy-D-xylulose-5-phosphate reductoisomerase, partial [Peptostreptococcaceae bacterium]
IQYALSFPDRIECDFERLDLAKIMTLTFEEPDMDTFPCLKLAYDCLKKGGTYSAVLNSANEVLVSEFLKGNIGFYDIPKYIEMAINAHVSIEHATLEEILEVDKWAREYVNSAIEK